MAPPVSMMEAMTKRSRMRTAKGKEEIKPSSYVDRKFESLLDLLNIMRDTFPNCASLDSFSSPSKLNEKDVQKIKDSYHFPSAIKVRLAKPSDRTCNWHPERLCVYWGALDAGFRFPVDNFIIRLLAEYQIHPCQLYPNSWRYISIFLIRCRQLGIHPTTTLFRSIFVASNSSDQKKGWVSLKHRAKIPHMVNPYSLPDSQHFWEREFVILEWKGGDWGNFFVKRFGVVKDSKHFVCDLDDSELQDRDWLLADDGCTHYKMFLNEKNLIEAGLSFLSVEGNFLT